MTEPAGGTDFHTEDPMANEAGTTLTCSNDDCGCQLRIEKPCPHGDTYTCACGHPLEEASRGEG